jgi:hypothetical protein
MDSILCSCKGKKEEGGGTAFAKLADKPMSLHFYWLLSFLRNTSDPSSFSKLKWEGAPYIAQVQWPTFILFFHYMNGLWKSINIIRNCPI